jgi:hypothetical protein
MACAKICKHFPEIIFRLKKKNHIGLVIASPDPSRIRYLQDEYARRIYADFFAKLPPPDKPTIVYYFAGFCFGGGIIIGKSAFHSRCVNRSKTK